MSRNLKHYVIFQTLQYCYLWKVLFVLFVALQTFFWSVNCTNTVYKLCNKFWKCQDTQTLLILECVQYWHKQKDYFQLFNRYPLSYFCWILLTFLLNYRSRVSIFHNFFLTCSETEAICIFESFEYCHLWKVQLQLSSAFLAFFHLACKLLKLLFVGQ